MRAQRRLGAFGHGQASEETDRRSPGRPEAAPPHQGDRAEPEFGAQVVESRGARGARLEAFMIEWNIQSRARACQACGAAFLNEQRYHTMLFDEKTGYQRLDVCEPCWSAQYSQGATSRKGFVSHWQGVFEVAPARPEPIRKQTAESLLRKLVQLDDPKHAGARFILAVMLERKRLLKVKDQAHRDGRRVLIYEQATTGDVFAIEDPDLRLDQLEEVQRDVATLLEQGPESAAATAPAPRDSSADGETQAPGNAESASMEPAGDPPAVC
jgi:hypothetical protein